MPIYNDPDRGAQALEALLKAWKSREIEIIVVDDGSTNRTLEMIQTYPIQLIRNSVNKGQSYCRNIGAEAAKGEFILFLDSDVIIPEDTFEILDQFIGARHEPNLAGMLGIFSLEHPNPEWASQCYNIIQHIHSATPKYTDNINGSCFLVKKTIFDASGGFDSGIKFLEDYELGSRFRKLGFFLQKGPLQFVHQKKVNWKWLYSSCIISGMSLNSITRTHAIQEKGPVSPFFRNSLLSGLLLFFGFVVCLLGGENATQFALMIWGFMLIFMGVKFKSIFQVNRNPFFFLYCSCSFIVCAFLATVGSFFGSDRNYSELASRFWRS
jgi:glycosyltransferase involved in cell wall biosynthesis